MRMIQSLFAIPILLTTAFASAQSSETDWLVTQAGLTSPTILKTEATIEGRPLFVAFDRIAPPSADRFAGLFRNAVVYDLVSDAPNLLLNFRGPVVYVPDGHRVLDFSDYPSLDFYGWEIRLSGNDAPSVYIAMITDGGVGRPDSLRLNYTPAYQQFAYTGFPFSYGIRLDADEPRLVAMARSGLPAANSDAYSYFIAEVRRFDRSTLRLLRNATFALNGYEFRDASLTAYFAQFDWYRPTITNPDLVVLTPEQRELVTLVLSIENP